MAERLTGPLLARGRAALGRPGALLSAVCGGLLAERARWTLWLPVGFGAGIAVYFSLKFEPPLWPGAAVTVLLAVAAFGARHRDLLRVPLTAALIVTAGFAMAAWRTQQVAAPVIERATGALAVTGTLVRIERQSAGRARLTLTPRRIGSWAPETLPVRVRITVRSRAETLRPGDLVRVRARLMPPGAPAAPGAFDFARMAWYDRLGGVGYAVGPPERLEAGAKDGWATGVARWRDAISTRIRDHLPGPEGGIAAAVMTGERSGVTDADWEALRRTGLAHLMAISGLHMTAISLLVFGVVRYGLALIEPVALTQPVKKWAAVAAAVAALGYLILSGASVSTQRAFIMVLIAMGAILADRPVFSLRTVALAALLILVLAPESLIGAGFQMSFAAVTALIAAYEAWRRVRPDHWMVGRGPVLTVMGSLGGIAMTTVIASLAVAPFAAYHFNRLGLYDLLANLIAVPIFSIGVMSSALMALIFMPLGLDGLFLNLLGLAIGAVRWTAHTISAWPGAAVGVAAMPAAALVAFTLGGLWLCLWQARWRLAGIPLILAGCVIAGMTPRPVVLIAADGGAVAVRDGTGALTLPFARRSDYDERNWLRRDGRDLAPRDAVRLIEEAAGWAEPGLWRCDRAGCAVPITRPPDGAPALLAYARSLDALNLDCARADLVISAVPVRGTCAVPGPVIDRFDLWWAGAHAVHWTGTGWRVETARAERGERPWVLPRAPSHL